MMNLAWYVLHVLSFIVITTFHHTYRSIKHLDMDEGRVPLLPLSHHFRPSVRPGAWPGNQDLQTCFRVVHPLYIPRIAVKSCFL
jgi:hypothetical protein